MLVVMSLYVVMATNTNKTLKLLIFHHIEYNLNSKVCSRNCLYLPVVFT